MDIIKEILESLSCKDIENYEEVLNCYFRLLNICNQLEDTMAGVPKQCEYNLELLGRYINQLNRREYYNVK